MDTIRRNMLLGMAATPALAFPVAHFAPTALASPIKKTDTQVPGIYRFWVGEFEVTALLDGHNSIPVNYVQGYVPDIARKANRKAYKPYDPDKITLPIIGYVVNTGSNTVLIDAGAPKAAGADLGSYALNLEAAGINPDDIDTMLFTHLHVDHVGALSDASGNRNFRNATLICSEAEWDFTHDADIYAAMPEGFRPFFDISRQMIKPYADHRQHFTGEKEVLPGITAIPLPGHTPGHTGFALHSNGESLFIWGDVIHLSGLQFANPEWGVVFDTDPEQAKATRMAMLDRASSDRMAVAGMHVDFPGIGYVEREGAAYRYISAPWQPSR